MAFKKRYDTIIENVSTKYKQCFVQTLLQIVNIALQNILTKYVIVQIELNIVSITTSFVQTFADCLKQIEDWSKANEKNSNMTT